LTRGAEKKPEVMVPQAPAGFDEAGRLTDEATRARVRDAMAAFLDWIHQERRAVRDCR